MSKIPLLHLVTGLGMGGAERVVLDLATNLDRNEFDVHVVSLSEKTDLLDEFIHRNIQTVALKKRNGIADFLQILGDVNRYVKEHRIRLIHAHMTHAMIVAALVRCVNPGVKIVFTSHNITFGSRLRTFLIYLLKPFRNADILFSDDHKSPIYIERSVVIPNGIDVSKYTHESPKFEPFTFLAVGRLQEVKNHALLIEIARELKARAYAFQILIAGDGVLRKTLQEKISEYRLDDCVQLLGIRKEIPELMAKSHVLVQPSLWEGLPIVLLESGASRLPVISTPVGSIPSLLSQENATLSTLEDFQSSMEEVMNHYPVAEEKAQLLQQKIVGNFSIQAVTSQHENLYRELLS